MLCMLLITYVSTIFGKIKRWICFTVLALRAVGSTSWKPSLGNISAYRPRRSSHLVCQRVNFFFRNDLVTPKISCCNSKAVWYTSKSFTLFASISFTSYVLLLGLHYTVSVLRSISSHVPNPTSHILLPTSHILLLTFHFLPSTFHNPLARHHSELRMLLKQLSVFT